MLVSMQLIDSACWLALGNVAAKRVSPASHFVWRISEIRRFPALSFNRLPLTGLLGTSRNADFLTKICESVVAAHVIATKFTTIGHEVAYHALTVANQFRELDVCELEFFEDGQKRLLQSAGVK